MEFVISRTSNIWFQKENKPHKDAYYKNYGVVEAWFIKFDTLEELIEFIKQIDEEVVIKEYVVENTFYEIEIYDDYRE